MNLAHNKEGRAHQRFEVFLPVTLQVDMTAVKATLVSISAGGFAICATVSLSKGRRCVLAVPFRPRDHAPGCLCVPCEVVWIHQDYRIDTFYRIGLHFSEPLSSKRLGTILAEEEGSRCGNKGVA